MKFTLAWLKDHLDTTATLDTISTTLTAIGLEVEQITDRSASLKPFTVAKIIEAEKHPEADKLRVCKVQSDAGELQIVCGAANARAGIYVVLAQEGAVIPGNGMIIKKTKIRGVESNGMLCSAEELGLAGNSEGIIELPLSSQIGQPAAALLGADDAVIEIAITPNRADCLSVRGIARDLAAAGLGTLKSAPAYALDTATFWNSTDYNAFESPVRVALQTDACKMFEGIAIKNITNGPSPDWMRKRLEAVGQKPISVLVDVTNYLMLDLGRPMHAYDADKIQGNIVVRSARDGESFKALNGKEYSLSDGMMVIADDSGTIGLAGIIGGASTACSPDTKNMFLEVAYFDPIAIAKTGRALELLSDARYRFERGVDPVSAPIPATAAYLIHQCCGGTASKALIEGQTPSFSRSISFRPERVKSLGGIEISDERIRSILTALGFACQQTAGSWQVTPPSWRGDVEGEADLIEEVLRIHGYDHIPTTPLPKLPGIGKAALMPTQKRTHLARRTLAARGMLEACTWSFLPKAHAEMFGGQNAALTLLNPISADLDTMRPSLLPNLLEAAKKNASRNLKDNDLFEVGLQFHAITTDGQKTVAAGLRTGVTENAYKDNLFHRAARPADVLDAKADALALLSSLGLSKCDIITPAPAWYHPGRSGTLTLGGKIILGHFGELHPGLLPAFDLDTPVAAFEIFLDAIPLPRAKSKAKPSLKASDFQAVERDFAFIVDVKITAAEMTKALALADKQLITDVSIFDVYTGTGVEHDKKSVAIKVTLQSPERTLSEADITTASNAIIAAAAKGFGGQLRQ